MKRESEKIAASGGETASPPVLLPDLRPCFVSNDTMASYEAHCAEGAVPVPVVSENEAAGGEGETGGQEQEQNQGGGEGEEL